MNDKSRALVNASQIRAARALLDWSQEDLAKATGLSIATIRKIESGHISPRDKTMQAIVDAMEQEKIEFTPPMGVRLKSNDIMMIESDDSYLELMEDIYRTLKDRGGEVLLMYADNAITSEIQLQIQSRIRSRGIKFRFLVEEGDTYLHYPIGEYRWMPRKFFDNSLHIVYANKVGMLMYKDMSYGKEQKILLIDSAPLAKSMRNTFEFMWENCRQPNFTTAPKIYA